ncbi:MAG: hypothetical protein ACK55X_07980 [Synechococcaceae cyanobacterium]
MSRRSPPLEPALADPRGLGWSPLLGLVFRKAQNKIQDPAKRKRLIADLLGKEQWLRCDADIKGDAYAGQSPRAGAGRCFGGSGGPVARRLAAGPHR